MSTDKRLYNEVARKIRAMIDSGQFPPGSRLPAERDLAKSLGVSRVTIREAQIALQAQQLIEVRTGSGAKVLPPRADKEQLPDINAFELTEARTAFEAEAAALAAININDAELDLLDQLVVKMGEESGQDGALHEDLDRQFHMEIARASRNAAVLDTIERLWRFRSEIPQIKDAYESICGISPTERLAEHRDIASAIRSRDAGAARQAMRRHFACIIEAMLKTAERQAIEAARRQTNESRARFLESSVLTG